MKTAHRDRAVGHHFNNWMCNLCHHMHISFHRAHDYEVNSETQFHCNRRCGYRSGVNLLQLWAHWPRLIDIVSILIMLAYIWFLLCWHSTDLQTGHWTFELIYRDHTIRIFLAGVQWFDMIVLRKCVLGKTNLVYQQHTSHYMQMMWCF